MRLAARKALLLLSCAADGCVAAMPASAQNQATPAAPITDPAPAPTEIIVTAQRRSESIQRVPMTIQALSGSELSQLNVQTFDDLLKFTPNVTFGNNGPGQGAIFIRGLSAGFAGNQSSGTIAPFPNVALYLDDQSMQFPARNADVYLVDMERVEVLEGPQGTLFGGGAEAGAVRYITSKPKMNEWSGHFEGSFGGTANGAPNGSFNATINIPILTDKVAVRAVIYDDHRGGYIDNVPSTFTRSNSDTGNYYFGNLVNPGTGLCPNGLKPLNGCTLPATQQSNGGQYDNYALAKKNFNPIDYVGGRVAAQWDINPDWNLLVAESFQDMDAEGSFATYPISSDFQPLGALQTTVFTPSYNRDRYWNSAWTLSGKIGGFSVIYTGAYLTRHVTDQQDYSNYSRTGGGMYYQCTGGGTGWGAGAPFCYSPVSYWKDQIRNTHQSHEVRVATPENKRARAIVGGFWEQFHIDDIMNFNYKTIPTCNAQLIGANAPCSGVVQTVPGSTANRPGLEPSNTAFGEDTQRGYTQYAFFGSVDFDLTSTITLTGGTRYYHYSEFEVGSQFETYAGLCYQTIVCAPGGSGNVNIDKNNDHVNYHGFRSRAVITWKPLPKTLAYALFSQGFRPGGFNRTARLILNDANGTAQFNRPNGYAPDSLTNWEAGLKTDLLNHKVQLNLSGYHMIWENVQFGFFNPAGGFGNTSFVTNGPSFHIDGVEAQLVARPMRGLSLQGGATYNESSQSNSPCLVSNVAASLTFGQCITSYYKGAAQIPVQSPYGSPGSATPFSPTFQGDLRGRYDWHRGADLRWFMLGGVTYTGPAYNQPSTYPSGDGVLIPGTTVLRYRQPGYAILDASVGFSRDKWTFQVFGDNLTNTHASTFTSSAQFIKSEVPVRPLTYGVRIINSF